MKLNLQINKKPGLLLACCMLVLIWTSCKVEPLRDPNNPGAVELSSNPSLSEIQNLVTGIESGMRLDIGFYYDDVGVIGREFYRFSNSDPRVYIDLLGEGNSQLDDNTFYTTNPYAARYRVVKNTNILLEGLQNTTASISVAQKAVGSAYAKTIQAHELLMNLNLQNNNGIRVDVADPDALGPFLTKDQSLAAIIALLDNAYADLSANAGVTLPFNTTLFGDGTAGSFAQFNRALAARCKVYAEDWAGALDALDNSFLDLNGDLRTGAYYTFSTTGGDILNPLFVPRNIEGEIRVVQPDFITDAAPNDNRLSKAPERDEEAETEGLVSKYDFFLYPSNVSPIPIIRNEELILIYAEANIQLGGGGLTDAEDALNIIRNAAGLPDYGGAVTQPALIDEMLNQRRYSLFGEGHRWVDMRRYDRLGDLPIDRAGDDVWVEFPRPSNEH
jgi:starch-binding outer membrane protein, SusD/RagB family